MKTQKIAIVLMIFIISCRGVNSSKTDQSLDYSYPYNWVSQPLSIEKEVDVFYVYPTIYHETKPLNMDISNPSLRANAKGLTIAQAGIYAAHANLFAPFYRQQTAATQSMTAANGGIDAFQDSAFKIGAEDIEKAFDYYLKNLNTDRPFILASHSQGTMTLIHLMRKRFNNPALQKRLVAAYLIGYSITKDDIKEYPWMKPAQGEEDTGVIISFNTEGANAGPSPVLLPGAFAINPLNWKTDETPAARNLNLGAKFFNDATGVLIEEIPNFASAQLDKQKGVLIASNLRKPNSEKIDLVNLGRWSNEVYHRFDYAFWFNNLKANVKKRIMAFERNQNIN